MSFHWLLAAPVNVGYLETTDNVPDERVLAGYSVSYLVEIRRGICNFDPVSSSWSRPLLIQAATDPILVAHQGGGS